MLPQMEKKGLVSNEISHILLTNKKQGKNLPPTLFRLNSKKYKKNLIGKAYKKVEISCGLYSGPDLSVHGNKSLIHHMR
jgi:hypothetical protein